MKKKLIATATTLLGACMLLAGCRVNPKVNVNGSVTVNGSEIFSEQFSYEPGKEVVSELESGFPGGLDDDGPGADEAVSVLFMIENDNENLKEKAVISGLNLEGGTVWTYETKEDPIGQVDGLQEIDIFDGKYVFVAFGDVICLDVATGKELWVNHDFKGHGISWDTNDAKDKLYLCGYFGPSLFVMDLDGNTINRITSNDDENYWAYEIKYVDENRVDVTYESTEKVVSYNPNGPSEQ